VSELGTGAIRTIAEPFPATPSMHGLLASAYEVANALVSGDGMFLERQDPGLLERLKRSDPDAYDQIMRRWEIGGYSITPENCVESETWDPDCAAWTPTKPELTVTDQDDRPGTYNVRPFAIDSVFECDASGFQVVDFRGRVERQLAAGTSKAMEFEFATGTQAPENPNLVTGATVLGGGAAFSAREAFALLGQYLSNTSHGGIGMLHAPTLVVDEWLQDFGGAAIKEQGDRLRSMNRGDIIVSGAGYPGHGPGGITPQPGQAWVYATSPVQYRLGEIFVFPEKLGDALDRAKNNIEYRAIRQAAVGFDPCRHAAVLVQTQFSGTPGGS
jgi:hypothetical protein